MCCPERARKIRIKGVVPWKVVLHVLGPEEAQIDDLAKSVSHLSECGARVAFVQHGDVRRFADRFESAQKVSPCVGIEVKSVENVRSAEEVAHHTTGCE